MYNLIGVYCGNWLCIIKMYNQGTPEYTDQKLPNIVNKNE